jgi:hypothetical protein
MSPAALLDVYLPAIGTVSRQTQIDIRPLFDTPSMGMSREKSCMPLVLWCLVSVDVHLWYCSRYCCVGGLEDWK